MVEVPMRNIVLATSLAFAMFATGAYAAPCKDAHGKFIKCPQATQTAARCKDASGKFAKCSAPGAKPVAATSITPAKAATASKAKP
jgi:hypothetical protein